MRYLCVATALLTSAVLYYFGFNSSRENVTHVLTSTSSTATTTNETKTVAKPPAVVPAKDLHVTPTKACKVGGCSGEVCSDKEMMSNCMYRKEYACYKEAKCEVQPSGECGWTPSTELDSCLNSSVDVAPLPQ